MPEYDNNNRGVLFKNDKKESERHPDYKGNIEVDGVAYWLSAWIKTDKNGNKYMSLSVTRKDQVQQPQRQASSQHTMAGRQASGPHEPMDDSNIPFAPDPILPA